MRSPPSVLQRLGASPLDECASRVLMVTCMKTILFVGVLLLSASPSFAQGHHSGGGGGNWGGNTRSVAANGSMTESGPAGHYTFGLICQSVTANSLPVSTQATLTITPGTTAPAASPATEPAAAGGETASGGGGSMGIVECVILAALLGFGVLRTTQRGRRWLRFGQPILARRRVRRQEHRPR